MTDTLTKPQRSERMALVRSANTRPELLVRRAIHAMGYRYRLHVRKLPGSPDLVFSSQRKVIFVHGCFWHRHRKRGCPLARLPKSRLDFWQPKLEGNRLRDMRNNRRLRSQGWHILQIWECEMQNLEKVMARVRYFLENEVN